MWKGGPKRIGAALFAAAPEAAAEAVVFIVGIRGKARNSLLGKWGTCGVGDVVKSPIGDDGA